LTVSHLKNIFEKSSLSFAKTKKTEAPKFYFLPSKFKLAHKNWFNRYSSSKTHQGDKKAISASLPKPHERTSTRWRETAYRHWAHPGQRSHISPTWSRFYKYGKGIVYLCNSHGDQL